MQPETNDRPAAANLPTGLRQPFPRSVRTWRIASRRHWALLALAFSLITIAVVYITAYPPARVYLANGQTGSSQRVLAEKFRAYFARHGVDLVLVDPPAQNQGSAQSADKSPPVNARFVTAGETSAADLPGQVSLGSVQYAPIWLFYRGDAFTGGDPLRALANRRVAVGLDGASTRNVINKILSVAGVTFARKDNLFELTHQDAVERFIAGTIDAVFIIEGIDAPTIQKLIAAPRAQLYAFNLVDAYAANLPFLDRVDIPRGALNVRTIFPPEPTAMLASSTTLVISHDLPAAIQWLFLMAAREVGQERDQVVAKPRFFPAYLDRSVPLSPVVRSYYDSGRLPAAFEILPYWLASTFSVAWLVALALLAQLAVFIFWSACSTRELLSGQASPMREAEERLAIPSTEASPAPRPGKLRPHRK